MSSALLDSDSGLPPPSVPAPAAPPGIIPSASSGAEHSASPSPPPPTSPPSSAFHSVPSKNSAASSSSVVVPSTSSPKHQLQRKHLRKQQRDASPGASSTASDSARESPKRGVTTEEEMDMNSGGKGGIGLEDDDGQNAFSWPTQSTYDERRQLLCTEEESSDRCSSDEDDEKASAWNITREQLNYYTTQFFSMQPNPRGVIRGETAKEFFEKSRLPITELRKIWQLSDVTKDGSLSVEEFLTAMHLVVLRRNDIELPDELPPCLQPMTLRNRLVDRHNKDLYSAAGKEEAKGGEGQSLLAEDADVAAPRNSSPLSPNSATGRRESSNKSPSSVISSPGNRSKPANFDFRDARRNPNILQPVPIRHSPESPVIPTSDDDGAGTAAALPTVKQGRREVVYEQLWNQEVSAAEESLGSLTQRTLRKSENSTDEEDIGDSTEVDGAQLNDDASPESATNLPYDGPVSLPQFSDALSLHRRRASGAPTAAGKEPSPPLPPRSSTAGVGVGHARSSSLDLNRGGGVGPPALPPRQLSSGVVTARRDCKSIQMNIGQYREKNSVVARTINELHQEVSDALEERIGLEFQLEQLKSFGE